MASAPTPLPRIRAFEQLAYGLFLHFGLYSQVKTGEWYWNHHQVKREEYLKLFDSFTAADFDARAMVRLAKSVGMRYVCLTTRHHEGFSLYDTRGLNTYDAPHSPAGRDLIAEYAAACHAEGMAMFFYHTTLDWWHDDFDAPGRFDHYLDYLNKSVEILCTHYGKVAGFWFDGNWARKDRDWKEDALYAVIRRLQPEAIIVNNSSTQARGKVGHPEVDIVTFEQGRPAAVARSGASKYLAAEMCETVNSHWGIADRDLSQKSPAELIRTLAACRRFGANLLLNLGPTPGGALTDYDQALLKLIGRWIDVAGASIYGAKPTSLVCRGEDFVLEEGGTYYYFAHHLPIRNNMHLAHGEIAAGLKTVSGALPSLKKIEWVDSGEGLRFSQDVQKQMLTFDATPFRYGEQLVVRVARLST